MLDYITCDDMFHSFCNAINDIICILDTNLVIVKANLTTERVFADQMPLAGKKCCQILFCDGKACSDCLCQRALDQNIPQALLTKTTIGADGDTVWYEVYAFPLASKDGTVAGLILHMRDVTVRVLAERQLLQATTQIAQAQKLSSVAALTAGITHELAQPLNTIKVFADGMLFWLRQGRIPEPGDIQAKIQTISEQADRADQIIKHVRSFIQGERLSGEMGSCLLNEVVQKASDLVDCQLRSHGITVHMNLAPELPTILGDKIRLQETVINLLINAMQALESANLADKQITITTSLEDKYVVLEISDNGAGINEEIADKLFEPFVTTKSDSGGMGLGLSYVYSIMEAHGARIEARNNDVGGATFRLQFRATYSPGG